MTPPNRKGYERFQPHLTLAHEHWEAIVSPGDLVIDATCGNGHDTLKAAQLALTPLQGSVFALDIQPQAIEATQQLLKESLQPESLKRVHFFQGCHSQFPAEISPGSAQLIIYNLGYLPGGDKSCTTLLKTTQESIRSACELLCPRGTISITFYPGHPEGKQEEDLLLTYIASFNPKNWICCHHRWLNRPLSPSLMFIIKK